jgi:transposase
MKNADTAYIGIDVSKETLDIDAGDLGALKVANTPAQIRKALAALARRTGKPPHVCFESTGPYAAALAAECRAMALPHSVLNPWKVAQFARALAHAKTDRADASAIRRYAEAARPAPARPPSAARAEAGELLLSREAVMKSITAHKALLDTLRCPAAVRRMRRIVASLERQAEAYGRLIGDAVAADAQAAGLAAALQEVKGVGPLTAAKLAAWMPEIGTLGRRGAAALAGLAPRTRESGQWRGKAFTGGGRQRVRDALFMPATVAIRHDPHMRRIHEGLMARGKPYKVALTAVMRKLIIRLDAAARGYRATRKDAPA